MACKELGSASRLCLFCRRIESASEPCPQLVQRASSPDHTAIAPLEFTGLVTLEDSKLLDTLRRQPSSLCHRCSRYCIAELFRSAEPIDNLAYGPGLDYEKYRTHISQYEMRLGMLSSLHLTPSCQLCRLIYRILPSGSLNPADSTLKIVPFRSYTRFTGWEMFSAESRSQSAVFLGVHELEFSIGTSFHKGGEGVRTAQNIGGAIALDSSQTFPGRRLMNARLVNDLLDLPAIAKVLDTCSLTHGQQCQTGWPAEMATVRFIDVLERKVVSCPGRCEYVALSYVWGGVMPAEGALETKSLPRTIEDAITVTKRLGRRYLWVDALCINQRAPQSSQEAKEKQDQLGMMHLIYGCASLTIVAVAGHNSDCGLAGVSRAFPRSSQTRETIDGLGFFTVPPQVTTEMHNSIWYSRAWTLQEAFFATRALYLTANQAYFECGRFAIPESDDPDTYNEEWKSFQHPQQSTGLSFIKGFDDVSGSQDAIPEPLTMFDGVLTEYTGRHLTNEEDSINACLGILAAMEKRLFRSGFSFGLPVSSHPQTLAWFHQRRCSPKRRSKFPSWSWAGWQGQVTFPGLLISDTGDEYLFFNPKRSMDLQLVHVEGQELTLQGWVVALDVRTDPFSEAFVVGEDAEPIGALTERNFLHNNTLPSGEYSCLIIQRVTYQIGEGGPERERAFLLALEWQGQIARRKTLMTLNAFPGMSLMQAHPERRTVRLT
ncbi:HET-domain-containing protein [Xylariaceae sp. FL0804]|nr:HET-domain-containing protein [Xylariaceae sp. FL0804]